MWFSFGSVDVGEELRQIRLQQDAMRLLLGDIHFKLGVLMALVQVDQTVLDAFGATLNEIADAVQTIVDDESNPLTDADVSGITAPIARLQDILTKPEAPVEPTPDEPVEPSE